MVQTVGENQGNHINPINHGSDSGGKSRKS